jgi:hypothetical protein
MYCAGDAPCIADALYLRSRARYNDGSPANLVALAPTDGILLERINRTKLYLPLVVKK